MKAPAIALSVLGGLACLWPGALPAVTPDLPNLLGNDDVVSRRRELVPYVKSLRPEEVPAALQQAIAGHGAGRDDAIDVLSGCWVELDAPAALAFSRQITDRHARNCLSGAYYGAWAQRDTEGLLAATQQADAKDRASAIYAIAEQIGSHDPRRALELLDSLRITKMHDTEYFLFWYWAKHNLPEATEALQRRAKVAGYFYPCQKAVHAIIDRLFDEDPNAAANWIAQLPPGTVREEAVERLVSEWRKVDPEALALWCKSQPDSEKARNALLNLPPKNAPRAPWPVKEDPAFAEKSAQLDQILSEPNFWLELQALVPFIDGLTPAEFRPALGHLRNIPKSNRDTVVDLLVSRWSEVDLAGAIKAIPVAGTIHDRQFSDRFLADVYAAWAQRDPEAAFAAATAEHQSAGNFDVLRVVFATLARQDPVKAYAAFKKLNDANSHELITPIFTEWAVRDLPAATKALSGETHMDGAVGGIIIGLLRQSPTTAIAWAEQLPDTSLRDRARTEIARRWRDDPAAATAWLEMSPDFEGKERAFDDVAVNWVVRNPTEALHHAIALPEGKEKERFLFWGMAQLTYDNAETALQFARQLSGDKNRKQALTTVLGFWSEHAPTAAAEFLTSIKDEATPGDVAMLASTLSDRDPVSAVQWLDPFPASLDKAPALSKIAEIWYRADAPAATAWVNQLPAGRLYEAGAQGICASLRMDLPAALKWARSIADPKMRHDALYQAFVSGTNYRIIGFGDPHGVKGQIQGAKELTEDEKTKLIARIPVITFNYPPQPPQPKPSPAAQ